MTKDEVLQKISSAGKSFLEARSEEASRQLEFQTQTGENGKAAAETGASGRLSGQKSVILFIAYDVVNSTAYKDMDAAWPNLLLGMFHEIEKAFDEIEAKTLCQVRIWRIIGDEIIFTVEVRSPERLKEFICEAYYILLRINERNRNEEPRGDKLFIEHRHIVRNITLKATAWLSVVNMSMKPGSYYLEENESIHMLYQNNTKDWFREYYGNDIDAGFRLEHYTRSDRLVLSFEIAYLLAEHGDGRYLHIVSYEQLKGIWRNRLYPVIWYYRPKEDDKKEYKAEELQEDFDRSFSYDAAKNDPLARSYLEVRQNIHYGNAMSPLPADMYNAGEETFRKIAEDVDLSKKIRKIKSVIGTQEGSMNVANEAFMRVDCAAVCYAKEDKKDTEPKILVLKTTAHTRTDSSKWCFGSAEARVGSSVTGSVVDGYRADVGITVQPIMYDESGGLELCRESVIDDTYMKDPVPIDLFERSDARSKGGQRKGIICVAKIAGDGSHVELNPDVYSEHRFIGKSELESSLHKIFDEDDTVNNFARTAALAFDLIERYEKSRVKKSAVLERI